MKYYFSDYILDAELELLTCDHQRLDIEPKQFATLLLFCQQPGVIITREQLLRAVWNKTVVSDNTINKHIAGLRKLLGDDAKQPQFIETVPKKGYRFIATLCNAPPAPEKSPHIKLNNGPKILWALGFMAAIILLYALFPWPQAEVATQDIETLTRMQGDKRSISFFQNDQQLLFINQKAQTSELILQDLNTADTTMLAHDFESIFFATGLANTTSMYLIGSRHKKQMLLRSNFGENNELEVLSELNISGFRVFDIAYRHADNTLYMIAQPTGTRSRSLYKFNELTQQIEFVFEPLEFEVALSKLDTDPTNSKILLLGQTPEEASVVYTWDPDDRSSEQIHRFEALVRDVVWFGKDILFTDTPPAQRVLRLMPGSKATPQIMATSSEYLCCEMLYSSSLRRLIYRTNTTNFNVEWVGANGWAVDNSSIYDMLPSLLHHSEELVFVSKRTGKSQLYRQQKGEAATPISAFTGYRVVRALDVSPDDKHVIAIVDNQLHLLQLNSKKQPLAKTSTSKRVADASWLRQTNWVNNDVFVVTHQDKEKTWLQLYDVKLNPLAKLSSEWQQLFVDQQDINKLYAVHKESGLVELQHTDFTTSVEITVLRTVNPYVTGYQKIKLDDQRLYQQALRRKAIKVYDFSGQPMQHSSCEQKPCEQRPLERYTFERLYGFDVYQGKVVVSDLKYRTSDWHSITYP